MILIFKRGGHEVGDDLVQGLVRGLGEGTIRSNRIQKTSLGGLDVRQESLLELSDLGGVQFVKESSDTTVDDGNLLTNGHGHVLTLLQKLGQPDTTVKQLLGGSVKVRAELGESSDLTVLGQLQLHGTGHLSHRLGLGSGADTGYRQTDVNGGTDTLVEQLSLQEDLSIGNGNDIGGDIGGHITSLGLNDGKGSKGSTTLGVRHLSGSFKETRVEVENVTGVGLTTRGTSQQQRHLTVSNGLLGQVVEDDDSVHTVVSEVFTHSAARVRGQILQGSGIRGGSRHNNRVLHSVSVSQTLDNLSNGGSLLADGNVNAEQLGLSVITLVEPLLVNDGIDGNSGFASLSVTNDQLTLTTTNGDKRVNSLDTSLHRLSDGLSGDNTGGLETDTELVLSYKRALAVNGGSQSVNNTAQQLSSDRNVDNSASTLDNIAFLDQLIVTENDNTDVIGLQVKGHTLQSGAEFHHLLGLNVLEAIDTSNTVTNAQHTASLLKVSGRGSTKDSVLQDGADLSRGRSLSPPNLSPFFFTDSHIHGSSGLFSGHLGSGLRDLAGHKGSSANRCLCHLRSK